MSDIALFCELGTHCLILQLWVLQQFTNVTSVIYAGMFEDNTDITLLTLPYTFRVIVNLTHSCIVKCYRPYWYIA